MSAHWKPLPVGDMAQLACQRAESAVTSSGMGRINRLLMAARAIPQPHQAAPLCPLCGRAIPGSQRDAHHLVPKSKGGRDTLYLHRICHRQVHALLSETDLARTYNTAEALLAHPEVARFVAWVKTKPDDFMERTRKHHSLR